MRYVIKKSIPGGKADNLTHENLMSKYNLTMDQFMEKLNPGIKVKMDHTDSKEKAEEIAMDHLSERIDYYDKLESSGLADELGKSLTPEVKERIKQFLDDHNGYLKDEELHSFAKRLGYAPDEFEEFIYSLAMKKGNNSVNKAIDLAFWSNKIGGKPLSKKETVQALRDMVVAEYDAIQLYERFAESIQDKSIKKVVLDIADEEKVHVGEFLKLLDMLDPKEEDRYEEGEKEAGNKIKKAIIRKSIDYGKRLKDMMKRKGITMDELKRLSSTPTEYDRSYKLQDRIKWHGLDIAIENKKGSYRTGEDRDGKKWKTFMNYPYGRICGTKRSDNEHTDVYIGPDKKSEVVYVVHQNDPLTGRYDEDKCMIGFNDKDSAIAAYLSQYDDPGFLGPVSEFTIPEFKEAIKNKGDVLYRSPIMLKSPRYVVRKNNG